ncbi:MAG: hypothetical protein EPO32_00705 [Anaerolineae bacterium]|nr:MAG: hypothetical protein EPO32_00705 [Anaerolineae bacterium]
MDRLPTRYAHGLYLGGYGMLGLAALAAPADTHTGVWVLGLGLVAGLGSALLAHFGRHRSWQDLLDRWLPKPDGLIRGLVANAFLWALAGVFPVWIAMLLVELEVPPPYPWLGIAASGLFFQALAFGLRRVRSDYPAPFLISGHLYMLLALIASLPRTWAIFLGHSSFHDVRTFGLAFLLVQGIAVGFYAASAVYHQRRALAHLAAWLTFLPVTLVGIVFSGDVLPRPLAVVEFAWLWTLWSAVLLLGGWLLDRQPVRYAHGPYLFGYLLGGFALIWSFSDRLVNLYTFGVLLVIWIGSQALVYTGRHHSYENLMQRFWPAPENLVRRTAAAVFLFLAAYGFPIWLAQLLAYQDVPLAWRGLAFALTSPLYIAFGLALRRARPEYAWPLFSGGYALTAIGAMLSFEHTRLTIAVLAVIAVVYAASAYIFRQSFWLYLAAGLVPIIAVLEVRAYHGRLPSDWSSGVLLSLAFVYFALGQFLDRRTPPATPTVGTFALPLYAVGYLMSAVALGIASGSGDNDLAVKAFLAGAALYGLTAWRLREPLFLYPSVWLLAVPYYLLMAQTTLPPQYRGLGWMPFILALIAVGRTWFQRQPLGITSVRSFFAALTQPAMPFYLLAYGLSVLMLGFSQGDLKVFALAFGTAAFLYFGSAALFRTPRWFIPALLSVHLGVLTYFVARPSGNPPYWISLPFLPVTWLITLAGLAFLRWLPPKTAVVEEQGTSLRIRWPFAGHLLTPSWAQPFFGFAAADVLIWQAVALFGYETTILLGIGHFVLLGLLAQLWLDSGLAYGALALLLLTAGSRLSMAGIPLSDTAAWIGGMGLGLYLLARLTDAYCSRSQPRPTRLRVWVVPATNISVILTGLGVVSALPAAFSKPTIAAIAFGFAGALYVAVAYRGRYHRLGYAGMALLLAAWVILLVQQEVSEPQWYAIPAGLYFVTIGFLERLRARRTFALLVEGFGLAVLLLTSFIQSTNGAAGFPYFVLLLAEGLLVAWWAAVQQLRVPFLTGVAAVVLNVVAQVIVTLSVYDRFRWLIILGVGLMLVALAVVIERRRERIVTQARAWRETIESWN